ncbi:MAG: GGDEF domain-containing protein [Fimbriimonadaceae bacterium]
MSLDDAKSQLTRILGELGISVLKGRDLDNVAGLPLCIPLPDGTSITLEVPFPGALSGMDKSQVGVAVIDAVGIVRRVWGLARSVRDLEANTNVLQTPLAGLLDAAGGGSAAFYLDGLRYFAAPLQPIKVKKTGRRAAPEQVADVFVLVTNASEEAMAKRQASQSSRFANALKRVGRVLAANQSVELVCGAAAHEIASATDLAAVALWTPDDNGLFHLSASVGIMRSGQHAIRNIFPFTGAGCVAELVGASRSVCFVRDVTDHIMTAGLEAQFCYLPPGSMCVLPLLVGDRLLGILELIAKKEDLLFDDHRELFETFAEHLSLALNAANMYETAEQRASKDALTGIANHRTMQEFLLRRFAEAKRNEHSIGVLMIDVDHFRAFNEEEGHDAGDAALQQVANTLKQCVRPYDLAARYGGEEFTVIMPGSNRAASLEVASRIRSRVEAEPFVSSTGRSRHLTVSIGCATYPECAAEPKSLLKAADSALFEAKRSGRNQLAFCESFVGETEDTETIRPIEVDTWIAPGLETDSAKLLANCAAEIDILANKLPLSATQVSILRSLLLIAPTYRAADRDRAQTLLDEMESVSDCRVLLPSLYALHERFDGGGPIGLTGDRIPLLARVLHVLIALYEDDGMTLLTDPDRFDPEIVSLMGDWRSAA